MDIEQSITLEKKQVVSMLKNLGVDVPTSASLSVSKTKSGEKLVVKWIVDRKAAK